MRHASRSALSVIAICTSVCLLFAKGEAAAQQPDFTGVWTTYNEPGQAQGGRGAGPALPVNEVAKQKIARYQALVSPTGDTPGGYCLGTGMPGSMLGSGGYPMEIHQRPEQLIIVYEAHNEIDACTWVAASFRTPTGYPAGTDTPAAGGKGTPSS